MATPIETVECMVDKALKYLPEYRARTGDVRAICAAKLYGLDPIGDDPYDSDLVRVFGGFKNEDGFTRTTYDPILLGKLFSHEGAIRIISGLPGLPIAATDYISYHIDECGWRTCGPNKNWRGGSGNP